MKMRLKPISAASIAVFVFTFAIASVAEAKHDDLRYEYHFGDDLLGCMGVEPTDPPIQAVPGAPSCRPEATAEDFSGTATNTIAIQGGGVLTIKKKDGKPKRVKGSGTYARFETGGIPVDSGTWKAKKLLMFDPYGPEKNCTPPVGPSPCAGLPAHLQSGRVLIRIELRPDGKKKEKMIAVLEVGCRLPGNKGIVGTIEGVRVMVNGGLNYNIAADPKSTIFVDLQLAP